MQPTVGRIVHYRLASGDWRPALVIESEAPNRASLLVFTKPNGENRNVGGHSSLDGHSAYVFNAQEGENAGEWRWPPIEPVVGEMVPEDEGRQAEDETE